MIDSRLQIRRVHAQYLVPSDHPSPGPIKDRLDHDIKRSLSQVLSNAFSSWFSETNSSLWFVRRLEIDLAVNASGDSEHVTRTFTRQLGRALDETLQDGTDHSNVVRFASPAEYLSHFLADLAAGDAWGRWYYESFFGLRMLPTSAALRTAVCNSAERGRDALLQLQSPELKTVLRAINRQDTKLILESLSQSMADDSLDSTEIGLALSPLMNADSFDGLDEWGRALYLYLRIAREQKERGSNATDAIAALLHCSPDRLRDVAEVLNTQTAQAGFDKAETSRRSTAFGGVFLRLPLLDEMPLVEALRDWPHADEAAAISLVRFLMLIKCAGPERGQRILFDPLLRDLLLVPPSVFRGGLKRLAKQCYDDARRELSTDFGQLAAATGRVTDRRCILACATLSGSPVFVLIDEAQALWLVARHFESSELTQLLGEGLSRLEQDEGTLFCDPTLLNTKPIEFRTLKVLSLPDTELARLGKLSSDLSYLKLPDSLQLSPSLDLALSVASQHLMRNFAWRLPGFAQSNLRYLSSNFLYFTASVEEETTRRVVRLSSPPLRLVLSITGMMRQTYRLGWLDDRPLVLFEEA